MNSTAQPIVAIIGAGEMGAAVGRRLMIRGARVVTSLQGRSRDSAARVSRAGLEVIDDDAELVRDADFVLSIVPPAAALEVAERLQPALARSRSRPIFADCNAIAPATAVRAGERLAGCRYVDAGIIGGPPPEQIDSPGPRFYASGPFAREFAALGGFGLDIAVLDGPIGAASALKLSYAGLTKGIIALGSAMVGAAARWSARRRGQGVPMRFQLNSRARSRRYWRAWRAEFPQCFPRRTAGWLRWKRLPRLSAAAIAAPTPIAASPASTNASPGKDPIATRRATFKRFSISAPGRRQAPGKSKKRLLDNERERLYLTNRLSNCGGFNRCSPERPPQSPPKGARHGRCNRSDAGSGSRPCARNHAHP